MRNIRLGYHLLMVALLVMAFAGFFSPAKTGNFAQNSGGWIFPAAGIITIWIIGVIVLRIVGRAAR